MIEPTSDAVVEARKNGRFFFSSRRRYTRFDYDWSSDVCSSDLSVLDRRSGPAGVALELVQLFVPERPVRCAGEHGHVPDLLVVDDQGDREPGSDQLAVELRSEERRVGKECRCGGGRSQQKKNRR